MSSRRLIEEQFDQKVNLAMGNALSDFNKDFQTNIDFSKSTFCNSEEGTRIIPFSDDSMNVHMTNDLKSRLDDYMSCYGIEKVYQAELIKNASETKTSTYCCSIQSNADTADTYSLGVTFLDKDIYLFDRMKFMFISSVLVFLLLTAVSFVILRALIYQKKVTDENIDFFNNTAHELKTPLTNISLALKLLMKKDSTIVENMYVKIIDAESAKLKNQIDDILHISKINGIENINLEQAVDVKRTLQEVIDNMQLRIEQKEAQVSLQSPNENISILGDKYHLSNVFRNLIDNALKYSEHKPKLIITISESKDQVKIGFRDNGIGLSKYDQERIFRKFHRVNTGDLHDAKGFGIGLAYVKSVIDMHKGLIKVQSELKKGSRFDLIFPVE